MPNVRFFQLIIVILLVLSSCQKENHPPVIESLFAIPDTVQPGDTVELHCAAIDEDGEELAYYWFFQGSSFSSSFWVAPNDPGDYYVHVQVSDKIEYVEDSLLILVRGPGIFIDSRDGKVYRYITIGSQTWMAENLAYLPEITSADSMSSSEKCYYVCGFEGDNVAEAKTTMAYTCYGVWYNWPAAMDGVNGSGDASLRVQGVCPPGWHLPSDDEWTILEGSLGMSESEFYKDGWRYSGTVGGKLKEAGTNHWSEPNYLATNSSGFKALPAGGRDNSIGSCSLTKGEVAQYWTATAYDINLSWYRSLFYLDGGVGRHRYYNYGGRSVRCLRDD